MAQQTFEFRASYSKDPTTLAELQKINPNGHDFYPDQDDPDCPNSWYVESDSHLGPGCRRCGDAWCSMCEPKRWTEDCPDWSPQLPFGD